MATKEEKKEERAEKAEKRETGRKFIVRHTHLSTGHNQGDIVHESQLVDPTLPEGHQTLLDRFLEIGAIEEPTPAELQAMEAAEEMKRRAAESRDVPVETLDYQAADEYRTAMLEKLNRLDGVPEQIKILQDQIKILEDQQAEMKKQLKG